MFTRYSLRTTDLAQARRFYDRAVGLALPEGAGAHTSLEAWPLHERARAAGAPAHWLGHLVVPELEAALERWVGLGAQRLGPTVQGRDGTPFTSLRDPFGAVLALRGEAGAAAAGEVAWHQLHVGDAEAAWQAYAALAGWVETGHLAAPDLEGGHRLFAFVEGGPTVGSVAGTARWAGVHPHWLFHFPVDDVPSAVARVRAHGGQARDPVEAWTGALVAACDDPQGAAFGLMER